LNILKENTSNYPVLKRWVELIWKSLNPKSHRRKNIKGMVKGKDHTTGCIGRCAGSDPALKGKIYGFLNGEFTVCDTKDEFFAKIKAIV